MSFVLDNSVVMRWCFGDGKPSDLAYARRVMDALTTEAARVPAIWGLEVANVLVRAELQGVIDQAHTRSFLSTLVRLPVEADEDNPTTRALTDTLELARRHRLSSYDASYLELALREGLRLATLDVDVRKAAKRAGVAIF